MRPFYLCLLPWLWSAVLSGQNESATHDLILRTSNTPKSTLTKAILGTDKAVFDIEPLSSDGRTFKVSFDPQENINTIVSDLRKSGNFDLVQIDQELELRSEPPNDNLRGDQWYLDMVNASDAWSLSHGGTTPLGDSIVIAVIDNGFDLDHEDLLQNIWVNRADAPGDGIDNDNNGYIDDVHGWNFQSASGDFNKKNHGTSVLGLIGAKGNNGKGITGINWKVKLMPLSIDKKLSSLLSAMDYIKDMRHRYNESNGKEGAFIVAATYSGGKSFEWAEENPIWCSMYDDLGEVGILSLGATTNINVNVDVYGDMPSTCPSDYLIMVTSTDEIDSKLISAGYGPVSVDMGAPGVNLITTHVNNIYHLFSGTSAATPLVAGAVGLLYSVPNLDLAQAYRSNPQSSALRIKSYILDGTLAVADLEKRTATGGRLDLYNAIRSLSRANGGDRLGLQIDSVYPNPSVDEAHVTVHLNDLKKVIWSVSDRAGRTVFYHEVDPLDFPVSRRIIDTSRWPTGTYFLSVEQGSFIKSAKLNVHH